MVFACDSFCGCESYCSNAYNDNCDDTDIGARVYVSILAIIIVIGVSVRVGTEWFIFKDYFPLKQKSPMLCILSLTFMTLQVLLYPMVYTFNFFMSNYNQNKQFYKPLFYGFNGSIYLTYIFRSIRLVYAHEVDSSRSRTKIYQFFKNQSAITLTIVAIILLKIIPIIFNDYDDNNFYIFVEFNNQFRGPEEVGYYVKEIIHQFVWTSILIYCLWLQKLVHPKYSMKIELLIVIAISIASSIISLALISMEIDDVSMLLSLCLQFQDYPLLQMVKDFSVVGMYAITIVYPIIKKKIYHMLLPVGRAYDLVKTMRDFLMEPEFMAIFRAFLEHQSREKQTQAYTQALEHWKELTVVNMKFKANDDDHERLQSIKRLIANIEDRPVKQIHSNLISNLKKSILSFEESQSCGSDTEKEKYRLEIDEKIQQLQVIFLQKLDIFYKQQYRITKSYYYLRRSLLKNKKINVNMITLNMAIMQDSDDYAL